jgi:FkbM family methyltransferase
MTLFDRLRSYISFLRRERFAAHLPFTLSQLRVTCNYRPVGSVIHVGAHHGREVYQYLRWGFVNIYVFEPQPECFEVLHHRFYGNSRVHPFNCALGETVSTAKLYPEAANSPNLSSSASLLRPLAHLEDYPHVKFALDDPIVVNVAPLDSFNFDNPSLLVIDTQGFELNVLSGAASLLHSPSLSLIILEYWMNDSYDSVPTLDQIIDFLRQYGFKLSLRTYDRSFGDALFVRS